MTIRTGTRFVLSHTERTMELGARKPLARTWLPLLVPLFIWAALFLIPYLL